MNRAPGPRAVAAQPLRFGEIRPAGWLYRQIWNDLEHGFSGRLNRLVPELFDDDIYGRDRLTAKTGQKDLGTLDRDETNDAQRMWWNSETQSNWWDGLLRAALLVGHPRALHEAHSHVEHMLDCQDEDGYMGIYAPDLRYCFRGENGELWAQASMLRGLLAYHEATGRKSVLRAVERAVAVTMAAYPVNGANPFELEGTVCGPEHGLMFSDVVDRLFFLTGNTAYRDYARWLYRAFSTGSTAERDAALPNLLDDDYRFEGHAVHTYEHLRALVNAVFSSDDPELERALRSYLDKLEPCLAPSGGPIGDENILGREADPATTGYEYCSMQELLDSYATLLHKDGDPAWADRIEWLLFNAAQGARRGDGRALAYCNADNVTGLVGYLDTDLTRAAEEVRFKYSPAHQDAAVCCAPNATRIYPYYVQNMWQRRGGALVLNLYGPSVLETEVGGRAVTIRQQTRYPFGRHVSLDVSTDGPVDLILVLRKPGWAESVRVDGAGFKERDGYLRIEGSWSGERSFKVFFGGDPAVGEYRTGGRVVRWGPLLFALPLDAEETPGREYAEDFRDAFYRADGREAARLRIADDASFALRKQVFEEADPWPRSVVLHGYMNDAKTGEAVGVELVPMGATVLRRVCFDASPGASPATRSS